MTRLRGLKVHNLLVHPSWQDIGMENPNGKIQLPLDHCSGMPSPIVGYLNSGVEQPVNYEL